MSTRKRISLGWNAVPKKAKRLLDEVWKSGQFSPGPMVRQFESQFAYLHKVKHAVFVNSGTDALRISLLALKELYGWPDGCEVAVPATTFVATVNVIYQAGLVPFFVDVGMSDYLINPDNLERRVLTAHTKLVAVAPVHLFGQSCRSRIFDLAKKYKLRVLEDSCETILNPIRGDVSCYSTFMAHHLTTGVGGFAVTNDSKLNLLIRSYANHGRDTDYLPGYAKGTDIRKRFKFDRQGYSSRGTEFEAALGISQLDGLQANVNRRRDIFNDLTDGLSGLDDIYLDTAVGREHSHMMFPIVLKENSNVKKYDLCKHLEENGIETRDMMPIVGQPCYSQLIREEDFPVSRWIKNNGFYLPCHPGMTNDDVAWIVMVLDKYLTTA